MKEIKIVRTTFAGGDLLEAGAVVTVDDREAVELVSLKKAEMGETKKKKATRHTAKAVPIGDNSGTPFKETNNDGVQDSDGLPLGG